MRIGELAAATGIKPETIRYYEREGLLPAPARAANNYRLYGRSHQRRLTFLKRLRELGFRLDEARELLAMIDKGETSCARVETLAGAHLEQIRARRRDLDRLESAMADLVSRCHGRETPDCSLLEALFDN